MKRFPLFVILALSLVSSVRLSSGQELTTAELARHLGISSWRIPKDKLPDSYKLTLYHLNNGQLTKKFTVGEFKKGSDLLICTRWLLASVSISVDDGTMIISTRSSLSRRPVFTVENKFEGVGIPLLLCYGDEESANIQERHKDTKSDVHSMAYSKAEHGLAVVITKCEP